jgi:hypothetical protein
MEPASLGVILDSSVAIEAERQHLNVAQFPDRSFSESVLETPHSVRSIVADWRTDLPGGHSGAAGTPHNGAGAEFTVPGLSESEVLEPRYGRSQSLVANRNCPNFGQS